MAASLTDAAGQPPCPAIAGAAPATSTKGMLMTDREAACSCGQLRLTCVGEPARVSMCHCLSCQRRTGSTFSVQAWYPRGQIRPQQGIARQYVRVADSGRTVRFSFCPDCGSTMYWEA